MSLDAFLIHSCTLQRSTKAVDPYNNETRTVWDDIARDVPFRLVARAQGMYSNELRQFLVATRYLGLLPGETDIREDDRITDVILETGIKDAGPYRVVSLLPRRSHAIHHLSAALERVS